MSQPLVDAEAPRPVPVAAQTSSAPGPAPDDLPEWRVTAKRARRKLTWGLVLFFPALFASAAMGAGPIFALPMLAGCVFFALSFAGGWRAFRQAQAAEPRVPIWPRFKFAGASFLFGGVMLVCGIWWTVVATFYFVRGRQLRRRGRVMLPPVKASADWTSCDVAAQASPELREALAARWRHNGRSEHASVAAFARLTLDLIALGAPPALIADANRDSLDEIRHAELCFSLARALDGREAGPGAFPEAKRTAALPRSRTMALAKLAVDSVVDGALHEGLSAHVIGALIRRCEDPAIREVLRELAGDESRHAAHGWDVVEWCLAEGGAPVAWALAGALRALPREIDTDLPEAARDGSWERYGIHGVALERAEHAAARARLVARVEETIGLQRAAA